MIAISQNMFLHPNMLIIFYINIIEENIKVIFLKMYHSFIMGNIYQGKENAKEIYWRLGFKATNSFCNYYHIISFNTKQAQCELFRVRI